jgi:hypothetical protein
MAIRKGKRQQVRPAAAERCSDFLFPLQSADARDASSFQYSLFSVYSYSGHEQPYIWWIFYGIVGGLSENPDKIPEHRRKVYAKVQVRSTDDARGDKESPKYCSCLRILLHVPSRPFYRETKGLLHSENALESTEYF